MTNATANRKAYDHAKYLERRAQKLARRRPDPLLLLTPTELAYIAGIIDGEGAVFIGAGNMKHITVYPIVKVAMTDRCVVDWLARKFGRTGGWRNSAREPTYRDQWCAALQGARAQLLCKLLLPYLIVKRLHAELIVTFPGDERRAPGKRLSAEVNRQRFAIRDKVNALNIRGGKARRHYIEMPQSDMI